MISKKGETESNIELWFLIAAFLLAAVAGIDLLKGTVERIEGTILEKNFIARDLALTLDAIYAAPGEIEYVYNLGNYSYYVDVVGDKVFVKEKATENNPVFYRIVGVDVRKSDGTLKFEPLNFKTTGEFENCNGDRSFTITKNNEAQDIEVISIFGDSCGMKIERSGG